jgi:hypothetical protein
METAMYFATDLDPIIAAMEAKAPRPIEDIVLEMYPDCTVDANGRGHAPCDGYECPYTMKQFRAGEYLPFEPDGMTEFSGKSKINAAWFWINNAPVMLEGSPAQRRAGAEVAKEQTAEHDRNAAHVGVVGQRSVFDLTFLAVFAEVGFYGPSYTHYMRDQAGNSVVYRGSKSLPCKPGEKITLRATVKSHWTGSDGRRATYINRPKVETK